MCMHQPSHKFTKINNLPSKVDALIAKISSVDLCLDLRSQIQMLSSQFQEAWKLADYKKINDIGDEISQIKLTLGNLSVLKQIDMNRQDDIIRSLNPESPFIEASSSHETNKCIEESNLNNIIEDEDWIHIENDDTEINRVIKSQHTESDSSEDSDAVSICSDISENYLIDEDINLLNFPCKELSYSEFESLWLQFSDSNNTLNSLVSKNELILDLSQKWTINLLKHILDQTYAIPCTIVNIELNYMSPS